MFADDTRILGNIASEEDVEKMQSDLNKIYKWAEDNNMLFNNSKFEILRYGSNTDIKHSTFYLTANEEIIEEKETLRPSIKRWKDWTMNAQQKTRPQKLKESICQF